MWVEKEAPMKETLKGVARQVSMLCQQYSWLAKTYASSTTPIRKQEAVPNRPIHQVTPGEINSAAERVVSEALLVSCRKKEVSYLLI